MTIVLQRDAIKAQRLVSTSDGAKIPTDPKQESIYRLIPVEIPPVAKQKVYRSIHADQAREEYKKGIKPAASMGPAKVLVNPPKNFLKKNEKHSPLPNRMKALT
jgi:hypothetical protein